MAGEQNLSQVEYYYREDAEERLESTLPMLCQLADQVAEWLEIKPVKIRIK